MEKPFSLFDDRENHRSSGPSTSNDALLVVAAVRENGVDLEG